MYSYEQRLFTFKNWPEKYKPLYIKKLAILGQHSTDSETLTTCCVYCKKKIEAWNLEDETLIEHIKHNNNCILFELRFMRKRKELIGFDDLIDKDELNNLSKTNFVRFDIKKNTPFLFCGMCGSMKKEHNCIKKGFVKTKVDVNKYFTSSCFYLKWLRGDFIEQIDKYLNNEIFVPKMYYGIVEELISKGFIVTETVNDMLTNHAEDILADFNLKMCKLEKIGFDEI